YKRQLLPLFVLPTWCALMAMVAMRPTDVWTWSAPLLAVLCGLGAEDLAMQRWRFVRAKSVALHNSSDLSSVPTS
ncbi:MAG: hypothetical protein N2037_08190, partial [Acidimicrobiales bacterium]|nr:hypothetical protein [Acidimicrobiales bacterium]